MDHKHANHFQTANVEADGVRLESSDAWARAGEFKAKLTWLAPADAWLLVPRGGAVLRAGDAVITGVDEGQVAVAPGRDKAVVHGLVDPRNRLHQDALSLTSAPVQLVPTTGGSPDVGPLSFPAEQQLAAGPFSCEVQGKPKRTTDLLQVRLRCRYSGEGIGIIDPSAFQVRIPGGAAFANEATAGPVLLRPGEDKVLPLANRSIQPGPHGVDL